MDHLSKIPNLPDDIVNSIFLELPVKSLLRFKITCKSWCYSIDDSEFMKSHLQKSYSNINRHKFLFVDDAEGKIPLSMEASITDDSRIELLDESNIPGYDSENHYLEVRSCSGLVFIHRFDNSLILWNPMIRKFKQISTPTEFDSLIGPEYGIGYDFVADDFKVLCIHVIMRNTVYPRYAVEIYSVKNQSWRMIDNIFHVPTDFPMYLFNDQLSFKGVIHISAVSVNVIGGESQHSIISFNLSDEKFNVTIVPSEFGKYFTLGVLHDLLCIMRRGYREISIWSLEKDEKTALVTWNHITKCSSFGSVNGIPQSLGELTCFKENGNIIWRNYDGQFIEYNARKNEYTELKLEKITLSELLYVESLVSLKISWD